MRPTSARPLCGVEATTTTDVIVLSADWRLEAATEYNALVSQCRKMAMHQRYRLGRYTHGTKHDRHCGHSTLVTRNHARASLSFHQTVDRISLMLSYS